MEITNAEIFLVSLSIDVKKLLIGSNYIQKLLSKEIYDKPFLSFSENFYWPDNIIY